MKLTGLKNIDIFSIALFFTIGTGIIARLALYIQNPSIWADELLSVINVINNSYADMFGVMGYNYIAPPLYMVIQKLLLSLSGQLYNIEARDMVLKFFPLISGIAVLPLFSLLVHKMFNNKYLTLSATAIMAVNQELIMHSVQTTRYSVEVLVSIVLLYVFYTIDFKSDSIKRTVCYSLIVNLSVWLAFSSFFIIASGIFVIFINIFKDKFCDHIKLSKEYLIKTAVLFAPMLMNFLLFGVYYLPIKKHYSAFMSHYWHKTFYGFFTLNDFSFEFPKRLHSLLNFPFEHNLILLCLFCLILLVGLRKYKQTILILTPVLLCIFAGFLEIYPFFTRMICFLMPIFAIYFSIWLLWVKDSRFILTVLAIAVLFFQYKTVSTNSYWALTYSKTKELYQAVTDKKINDKSVLGADNLFYYYNNSIDKISEDKYCYKFESEKLDKIVENTPAGDYLYIVVSSQCYEDDKKKLLDYISKNNSLEIVKLKKVYQMNNFSAKIKKIK